MNLREMIFATADNHKPEPVATPEWPEADKNVFVRPMTSAEWIELGDALHADRKAGHSNWRMARIAQVAACDADGSPIFTESDVPKLAERWNKVVERIANSAELLNGPALVELRKNSAAAEPAA